jgi:hypothetical protein
MSYGQYPEDNGQPTTRFGAPYRDESYGQPGYPEQQGYPSQPGYPPQQGYPQQRPHNQRSSQYANAYGAPVGSGAQFGVVGATLAGIGFILLIISFTAVTWFKQGGASASFSDISSTLDNSGAASGPASAYFGWLAWTLAIVGVVVAVAANLPSPASGPLRALGAVLAAAAIAFTFLAIRLTSTGSSYTFYLSHTNVGFYLALGGFLILGIGALIGPKRS